MRNTLKLTTILACLLGLASFSGTVRAQEERLPPVATGPGSTPASPEPVSTEASTGETEPTTVEVAEAPPADVSPPRNGSNPLVWHWIRHPTYRCSSGNGCA